MKWAAVSVIVATLALAQSTPDPFIVKAVEPDYGAEAGKPFFSFPIQIEVTVLPDGTPYSATADSGLPHNVVIALRQYRFRPAKDAYAIRIPFEKRIPIESYNGTRRLAYNLPSQRYAAAVQKLDTSKALQLERKLKPTADSVVDRTVLLIWAASQSDEAAREIRARQIAWLVQNQPNADVLRSSVALMNSRAGQLADPSAYSKIRQLWLDTIEKVAIDARVLETASNFLRVEDPQEVQRMLLPHMRRFSQTTTWLADTYALAALGVTSLDLETGAPATAGQQLPETPSAVLARASLMDSSDLTLLLPAFDSLRNAANGLADSGRLPEGYGDFCGRLAAHIRELKPNAALPCDSQLRPAFSSPPGRAADIMLAKRIKFTQPVYPEEAKARLLQGRVTLTAIINKTGKIEDLTYTGGPFVLYESSRKAVARWEYQPTMIDGQPVDIVTDIEVNYSMK